MHGGGFSLIRLFTSFAMLGAEWVMWVLVALSVASVAVILERARYYRSLNDDLDRLADDVRALLRKNDIEQARIAGRNEALAELKADRPVMTSAPPAQTRTPLQVITAHAFGEKVSPQELQAAYKARGI